MNMEYHCRSYGCNSKNITQPLLYESKGQLGFKCLDCGKFSWWPKEENKTKRPASQRNLLQKYGKDYCQWCMVKVSEYPKGKGQWAMHHIIEYIDGGESDPHNLMTLCPQCHSNVHHCRTYRSHWIEPAQDLQMPSVDPPTV